MNKKIIIGFAGKIGVGKTTTANWFVENKNFVKLSYGTPIKKALMELTGLPSEYFYNIELKEKEIPELPGITPRIMMQKLGTEYARDVINTNFFIWRMKQELKKHNHSVVIDDVRFDNEMELIRRMNGVVVHLRRTFKNPSVQTDHKSENTGNVCTGDIVMECLESAEKTAEVLFEYINKKNW